MINEHGIFAEHLVLGILVHDVVVLKPLPLEGITKAQSHKENDGKRESVRMNVGKLYRTVSSLITSDDLGSHVAHLTEDSEVLLVCGYVIVVTDEKRSGIGIEEEASVVKILVGISLLVKLLECGAQ